MHDKQDKKARVSGRDALDSRTSPQGGDAQRPGLGAGGGDAPPSNTASHNSNHEYFKALRWGVDSLYLSYPGKLLPEVEARLKKLKQFAQSRDPKEQAEAQYPVGVHVFEVKDRGAGLFPYVLQDNTFRVQLRHPSHTLPMAYVQISSAYLAQVGPVKAQQALYDILAILGDIERQPTVSRIDLFVDFTSPESMEWSRHTWITRAASVNAYAVDGAFSGWAIGTKGIISARLYDKLLEIESSKKFYLKDLWRQAGWREGEPVWRLEFEFKRDALGQRGLMTLDSVMDNLSGLWSYATTEWLRLALPNPEDQTRSRWPIHPIWGYLSSIDWQSPGGPALSRHSHSRLPSGDKLFSMAFSALIGFMAREGMTDWERGKKAFVAALDAYYDEKAHQSGKPLETFTDEKVALKAREFNSILNNPEFEEERKALELKRKAEAYRKASDGE